MLPMALAIVTSLSAAPARATVVIDPARAGAPISPYLYGQFIEHLGRCIRQGIWSEMLRDRKFLQEPGKSWHVVKPEGAGFDVVLDPAAAVAGEHGLSLRLSRTTSGPCGIRQSGIGLVAGKEYVGYAWLAAPSRSASVDVRMQWGAGTEDGATVNLAVGSSYRKHAFRFRAGATTDDATLSLTVGSPCHVWVGCVSLMPADNVRGMRPDTLELVRRVNAPITRWPGGNFVSGYNWKDGIGDRDRRPPRWERAWNDIEDNDFGLDEFMDFCRTVKTEPYICVNAGLGSAVDAADEVEYANGAASTRWGRERARNGHVAPYRVRWWGVGNEMYGNWQLGNVAVDRYADRHNAFVAAMRERDPAVRVIGVGAPGPWNDAILARCAGQMEMLSGHHYSGRGVRMPMSPDDARKYETGFASYSASVAAGVRGLVDDFRRRIGKGDAAIDRVQLAVDEWGIVRDWDARPDEPGIGAFEHYYCLGDAIAAARGLHEILRNADIVGMANWAQLVNVIAAIKTSRTGAVMDPVGHVLSLYREHLGGRIVPVESPVGANVDAVAAWDSRTRTLAVGLINHSLSEDAVLDLRVLGSSVNSSAAWLITGGSLTDTNVPGRPEAVTTTTVGGPIDLGALRVPARSVMVVRLATGREVSPPRR